MFRWVGRAHRSQHYSHLKPKESLAVELSHNEANGCIALMIGLSPDIQHFLIPFRGLIDSVHTASP